MNKAQGHAQVRPAPAKAPKLGAKAAAAAASKATQRTMGSATDGERAPATAATRAPLAHRSTAVKATAGANSATAPAKSSANAARTANAKDKASANQDATPGRATVHGKATSKASASAHQAAPSKATAANASAKKAASAKAAAAKGSAQAKAAPAAKQPAPKRTRKPRPSRAGQRAAAREAAAAAAQPAARKIADLDVAPADARPAQASQAAKEAPITNGNTLSSATLPEPAPITDLHATDLREAEEAPVDIEAVVAQAANDATEVGDVAQLAPASNAEADVQLGGALDASADDAQPAVAASTPDALEDAALIEAALAATMPPADVAGIDEEASLASVAAATPRASEASAAAAPRPGTPNAPDGAGRTVRDDPSLDRRIIEGMLDDKDGFLDKMHRQGFGRDAVVRRAAELGLSEALIRQVKGVAADLAGERPGRRPTPGSLGARTCLSCDRVFFSSGPGNRLCTRCRGGDAGLAQL